MHSFSPVQSPLPGPLSETVTCPRETAFDLFSSLWPGTLARAQQGKPGVKWSLFPAHHEVVLNPNICSAMAVMRCCPGRHVEETALSAAGHRKRDSHSGCMFFCRQDVCKGPGTRGLRCCLRADRGDGHHPVALGTPRARRHMPKASTQVERFPPEPLAAGLVSGPGDPQGRRRRPQPGGRAATSPGH